jgi:hypothetical protein
MVTAMAREMQDACLQKHRAAVEMKYGRRCTHRASQVVMLMKEGDLLWKGAVETFALEDYPAANHAFVWVWVDDREEAHTIIMLSEAPVHTAIEAVKFAFASGLQRPIARRRQ